MEPQLDLRDEAVARRPDGPLRDLLERILADEVGYARFGWRLLARESAGLQP